MIYYFSATGNSKWVAEELAKGTGDRAVPITGVMKSKQLPPPVKSGETLGLVFPVFAFAPPRFVIDFVRKLEVADDAFVYAVCTMGGAAGGTFRYLERFIRLNSCYALKMPSNYIVMSGREPEGKIAAKIAEAQRRLPAICESVKAKKPELKARNGFAAFLLTAVAAPLFNRSASDKAFHSTDRCTGCGLCAELCPLANISLENGRPLWHGNCMHCMACIQNCPAAAIEYGDKTRDRERYVFDFMK